MRYLIILITLVGCAPTVYTKQGGTQDSFARDNITCRQVAMQDATMNGLSRNMFVEVYVNNRTNDCLQSLGYSRR